MHFRRIYLPAKMYSALWLPGTLPTNSPVWYTPEYDIGLPVRSWPQNGTQALENRNGELYLFHTPTPEENKCKEVNRQKRTACVQQQ